MPPLFSTIIPTYNRRQSTAEAVESALSQECRDQEVIVVDDGSTDGTAESLRPYADRIRLLRQANAGPGAARNRGIAEARGRYVAFLDSDDLWYPWTLSTYAEVIEHFGGPAFVAGCEGPAGLLSRPGVAPGPIDARHDADYLAAAGGRPVWVGTPAAAIRTAELNAVGGFSPQRINGEDADLWLRLGTAPGFVQVVWPPVFVYRRAAGSAMAQSADSRRGLDFLLASERQGRYPGGAARRAERQRILTAHFRAATLKFLHDGHPADAWRYYLRTFGWNLRQGRLRYLAGFPAAAMAGRLRPGGRGPGTGTRQGSAPLGPAATPPNGAPAAEPPAPASPPHHPAQD